MADDGLKRSGDDLESDQSKRIKTDDSEGESGQSGSFDEVKMTMRILIEDAQVGGLIGKGGTIIKKMRTDTNCKIEIETSGRDVKERVVTVIGPVPKLPVALSMIANRLPAPKVSYTPGDKKRDDEATITLLVENNVAGGIIGKAGAKITQTRRTTGANIKISSFPLEGSSEKTVQVRGDAKRVAKALEIMVYQILAEPDKTVRQPYAPAPDYDYDYRPEYRPPPPPPHFDRRERWGPDGPYGPPRPRGPPRGSPYGPPPYYGPPPVAPYGVPPPPYPLPPPPRPRYEGPTTTVTIPVTDSLVGGIIGRGGYKINDIRQRSGAQIKVTASEPGSTERKIILTGPKAACDVAQQMINDRIKEQQHDRALQS
jgi:transcription antitermination factor NusA-like protein